jgi:hypothetical protein
MEEQVEVPRELPQNNFPRHKFQEEVPQEITLPGTVMCGSRSWVMTSYNLTCNTYVSDIHHPHINSH